MGCTFGIEEEYLLVDLASGRLLYDPPPQVLAACREVFGEHFAPEMFRSQVELVSPVFDSMAQARDFLASRRERLALQLSADGVGLLSAGSHPLGGWSQQRPTAEAHYRQLFEDYRQVARRSVVCGLHVHVGVPAGVDRIAVSNRVRRWLPLLLLLSASSPFWEGQDSGYCSYRRVLCGEWPRMGLPEPLDDWAHYQDYLAWLRSTGSLRTDGDCWWALRPSSRFPTLELRISDACPRLEDGLCIAGLFRQMVEWAIRQPVPGRAPDQQALWREQENYWRAMRLGRRGQFIGEDGSSLTAQQWLTETMDILQPGCAEARDAFSRAGAILLFGSSADHQLTAFALARQSGASEAQALRLVVKGLLDETAGQ
ncbi:carboxylate-amine ligase [Pseudomonas putida CSV86]|uniref:Putative glutamate--cysteine ligase 2 n=1 Tax=Pseudomonas bharatica CSV86 TaxID=1005395 RepID=L1M7T8_9PSED|nr:carboxylate-amine ligase [Pseudomonas bharatica]NNJ14849.1 carboxylate-amine ligase [Pseudomonas bharatica CSV86]